MNTNNIYDNVGRRLPFSETDEYLDNLISRSTEAAIDAPRKSSPTWYTAAVAASLALIIATGFYFLSFQSPDVYVAEADSVEDFLYSLSDEDVSLLAFSDYDEIPEY
ncbi:MAG: hypothetical protein II951_11485 [Bacteroidales bacterium]|jgi:hypothetical protein|nr:hypothetical protein [Bacteroidales bacterium]